MQQREKEIYKITFIGGITNLLLLILKFVAGFIGNSAAMIADAVHSLSDFLTDIVVVIFVKISSRKEDADHNYGHGKFETLATVIIGITLSIIGVEILKNGTLTIIAAAKGTTLPPPSILTLIAAIVSIVTKEILYRITVAKGREYNSQAVVANAWHHRSDAFSSIGTALGIGGAILLGPSWRILDPIAAATVSIFILRTAYQLSKAGIDELLEKSLPQEIEERIKEIILSVKKTDKPHHLRTRRIGNNYSINVHVKMDRNISLLEAHDIATEIEQKLKEEYGNDTFISIHMEPKKTPAQ